MQRKEVAMSRMCYILAMLLIGMLTLSCEHKELCIDHSHIVDLKVDFDWTLAPEANPKSMTIYLFSEDGTNPQRYELNGRDGGTIRVTPGVYHAIYLNSDTRNIDCRDTKHLSTFLITTKDEDLNTMATNLGMGFYLPRSRGAEDERIVRMPELLWSGNRHNIYVDRYAENTVTLSPQESVMKVSITIEGVKNLNTVSGMIGTLSGLSEGILADAGIGNDRCVTMPFTIARGEDDTTLIAEILSFGDCTSGEENHFLDLYVVLADGSRWNYRYDVTSQVHSATDKTHIHIILDELPIPDIGGTGENGGGFIPSIDEWNTVEIGIQM